MNHFIGLSEDPGLENPCQRGAHMRRGVLLLSAMLFARGGWPQRAWQPGCPPEHTPSPAALPPGEHELGEVASTRARAQRCVATTTRSRQNVP